MQHTLDGNPLASQSGPQMSLHSRINGDILSDGGVVPDPSFKCLPTHASLVTYSFREGWFPRSELQRPLHSRIIGDILLQEGVVQAGLGGRPPPPLRVQHRRQEVPTRRAASTGVQEAHCTGPPLIRIAVVPRSLYVEPECALQQPGHMRCICCIPCLLAAPFLPSFALCRNALTTCAASVAPLAWHQSGGLTVALKGGLVQREVCACVRCLADS